jgi:signal transduction histidine kinase/ligand-binding sensor domain-containing protein
MKNAFTLFSFVLALRLLTWSAFSQNIHFSKVRPTEDEISGLVSSITQDAQGYMWFTTSGSGLARYDGYQVITYKNDPRNQNSVGANRLECLLPDANDILWVGTFGAGLDRFNTSTGNFTHFRHIPKNPKSLSSDTVFVVKKDHEGTLWVGTAIGLDRFDPASGTFTHYTHKNNDPNSLSNNQVRAIYEDRQGTLWIGTGSPFFGETPAGEGGLNRLERKTGKFVRYMHDPANPHSLADNKVRSIFEDSRGTFWIGTAGEDGLQTMDRATGRFQRYSYDPLHPDKLSRPPLNKRASYDHVCFITEDALGAIWIGTAAAGINRYDPKSQKVTHYDSKDTAAGFISDYSWQTYTSRDGVLWITTLVGSDIYTVDFFHKNIPHYNLAQAGVFAFSEDKNNSLWIGTRSGLIRKDMLTGKIDSFAGNRHKQVDLRNYTIFSISKDAADNLWIASFGKGIAGFDPRTETFTNYRHDLKDNNSLISDSVYSVYIDKQKNVWIGTLNGLDEMDITTGKLTHFLFDTKGNNNGSNIAARLFEDNKGRFWVGTANGINQFDKRTGKFKRYLEKQEIYSIIEDGNGNTWVGSSLGLYKFNTASNVFEQIINPSTGKEFPIVYSITEDTHKNLWFTSSVGIVRYNDNQKESSIYGRNFGVNGSDFTIFAAYRDHAKQLYFGDVKGYYAFYPEELLKHSKPPEIIVSEFRINNKIIQPDKSGPLQQPLAKTKEIDLSYNQNVLSFSFAAIDYSDPSANKHLYKLENYDNDWHTASNEHIAYYFNIPPGKYIFKVKASNSAGVWAERDIAITINPPWWQTWWAYCLYALVLIGAIYLVHRYQKQRVIAAERERAQARELAQAKEIEKAYKQLGIKSAELEEQKEELQATLEDLKNTQSQLIQQEKMASLGELTAGIAHEIQNPLNFINNFSEVSAELVDEMKVALEKDDKEEALAITTDLKDNLKKITNHGKRADAIVKGMLQHSRASSGKKELTDINALADEYLRLSYHGLRAKNKDFNADFKTDLDESIGNIEVVPQDIGRVLLNLFNNAFYATNEKKRQLNGTFKPLVTVTTKRTGDKVEIVVKDNGNGMPKSVVDKIFQPFFTTKPTGQGTGLGLSLSYDIIKAHGGEIKVQSKEGEGSEFIIQLLVSHHI